MKLKKIASLALAGIMAVSMLAGCSTTGNEEENNNGENNEVVAASVADYANSLLSGAQKNVFEFKNSTELTAAVQKIAGDSEKYTSADIKTAYDRVTFYSGNNDLAAELKKELKLDFDNTNTDGLTETNDEGTKTVGFVYDVSGKLTESSAVQLVIDFFAGETMSDDTYFPATIDNEGLKCDYTAEISAVKVNAPDTSKNSSWVVAIVVTQNAVEDATV